MKLSLPAVLLASSLSNLALAQVATLQNTSFEQPTELCTPVSQVLGWNGFNSARWRQIGDGLSPALPVGFAHSGTSLIELDAGADFVAFVNDAFLRQPGFENCFTFPDSLFPRNWPQYYFQPALDGVVTPENFDDPTGLCGARNPEPVQPAGDDIVVSGYYRIPASDPLSGAWTGFKVVAKRGNGNLSDYQLLGEFAAADGAAAPVHTNDQWVKFEVSIPQTAFTDPLWPCPPTGSASQGIAHMQLFVMRFGAASTGTVYWDDISFSQPSECPGDFDGNGVVEVADIFSFLNAWFSQFGSCASNCSADIDAANGVQVADIFAFLNQWFSQFGTPCP